MVLSEGKFAYQGKAKNVPKYFSSIGYPFDPKYNPADMVLTILALDDPKTEKDLEKLENINSNYAKHIFPKVNTKLAELEYKQLDTERNVNVEFSEQLWILFQRSYLFARREPMQLRAMVIVSLVMGLLIAAIFGNVTPNDWYDLKEIANGLGLLILMGLLLFINNLYTTILTFLVERNLYH